MDKGDIEMIEQVGGNHYGGPSRIVQHWDWVEVNALGYLEGCATKYISRHREKGGLEDVRKGLSYVYKALELHREYGRGNRALLHGDPMRLFEQFCEPLSSDERLFCYLVATWRTFEDLVEAINVGEYIANGYSATSVSA
jgi:hypothetical protein